MPNDAATSLPFPSTFFLLLPSQHYRTREGASGDRHRQGEPPPLTTMTVTTHIFVSSMDYRKRLRHSRQKKDTRREDLDRKIDNLR